MNETTEQQQKQQQQQLLRIPTSQGQISCSREDEPGTTRIKFNQARTWDLGCTAS